MKRLSWFAGGAVAGALGASRARKKAHQIAESLTPANLARRAGNAAKATVHHSAEVVQLKRGEVWARLTGRASTVDDEVAGVETVIVRGRAVDPDKVVLVKDRSASRLRRRRSA